MGAAHGPGSNHHDTARDRQTQTISRRRRQQSRLATGQCGLMRRDRTGHAVNPLTHGDKQRPSAWKARPVGP
jgi:hypothetical protein